MTLFTDYSAFNAEIFDPHRHAHEILAGEAGLLQHSNSKGRHTKTTNLLDSALGKDDISVAISKLNFNIDDVSKQIKSVVCVCSAMTGELSTEPRSLGFRKPRITPARSRASERT